MVCEIYAFDCALARTLKLIRARGVEGTVFEIDLTRVVAADCTEAIGAAARRLLANDVSGTELKQRLQEVEALSPYVPVGILDSKTRIAERVTALHLPAH